MNALSNEGLQELSQTEGFKACAKLFQERYGLPLTPVDFMVVTILANGIYFDTPATKTQLTILSLGCGENLMPSVEKLHNIGVLRMFVNSDKITIHDELRELYATFLTNTFSVNDQDKTNAGDSSDSCYSLESNHVGYSQCKNIMFEDECKNLIFTNGSNKAMLEISNNQNLGYGGMVCLSIDDYQDVESEILVDKHTSVEYALEIIINALEQGYTPSDIKTYIEGEECLIRAKSILSLVEDRAICNQPKGKPEPKSENEPNHDETFSMEYTDQLDWGLSDTIRYEKNAKKQDPKYCTTREFRFKEPNEHIESVVVIEQYIPESPNSEKPKALLTVEDGDNDTACVSMPAELLHEMGVEMILAAVELGGNDVSFETHVQGVGEVLIRSVLDIDGKSELDFLSMNKLKVRSPIPPTQLKDEIVQVEKGDFIVAGINLADFDDDQLTDMAEKLKTMGYE